jgi:hypothetical protein
MLIRDNSRKVHAEESALSRILNKNGNAPEFDIPWQQGAEEKFGAFEAFTLLPW